MTREEARKAAEVMLAFAEGKKVEYYSFLSENWKQAEDPVFDWHKTRYRVAPQPWTGKIWVNSKEAFIYESTDNMTDFEKLGFRLITAKEVADE